MNLQSEMYAYSKGLEIISNRLMNVEKECFVSTAEDYGLTVKERYFDSITRASDVKSRREMLLSLLSVDETDFNLEIRENLDTRFMTLSLHKNQFDFIKECLEQVKNTKVKGFDGASENGNLLYEIVKQYLEAG